MNLQEKLAEVSEKKLLIGIDVAKDTHWAMIGDTRGKETAMQFQQDRCTARRISRGSFPGR